MTAILLFKVLCTPLLIGLAILASRRWGSFVGGCLAGLPSISGPISLCLALERGPAFAALAAHNALLGVGAVILFTLTYAWLAMRRPWYVALLAAETVFFLVAWGVGFLPHVTALAVTVGLAGPPLALLLMPKLPPDAPSGGARPQAVWVVPLQMLLGAVLVFGITEAAGRLGVHWSGVLAFYPVMIAILAPFCHASQGPYAARQLLAGLMTGFVGGTSFTVVVLFGVERLPLAVCYTLSTVISLTLCGAVGWMQRCRQRTK